MGRGRTTDSRALLCPDERLHVMLGLLPLGDRRRQDERVAVWDLGRSHHDALQHDTRPVEKRHAAAPCHAKSPRPWLVCGTLPAHSLGFPSRLAANDSGARMSRVHSPDGRARSSRSTHVEIGPSRRALTSSFSAAHLFEGAQFITVAEIVPTVAIFHNISLMRVSGGVTVLDAASHIATAGNSPESLRVGHKPCDQRLVLGERRQRGRHCLSGARVKRSLDTETPEPFFGSGVSICTASRWRTAIGPG